MPDCPWDVVDIVNIDVPVEDGDVSETESLGSNTPIEVKPSALGACQLHLVPGNTALYTTTDTHTRTHLFQLGAVWWAGILRNWIL